MNRMTEESKKDDPTTYSEPEHMCHWWSFSRILVKRHNIDLSLNIQH